MSRNSSKNGKTANMKMNDRHDKSRKWLESTLAGPSHSAWYGYA